MMSIKTIIMNSKIRVEHDFTKNNPYIQFNLEDGDVNDGALKHFIYQANSRGIQIDYSDIVDGYNKNPRIVISDARERERAIVNDFEWICKESLPQEHSQALENILFEIRRNRVAFKEIKDVAE